MKNFFTKSMTKNLIYYGLCILALVITPFLAKPIAPLFDWAGYSLMRGLFKEVFTIIFWAVELLIFNAVRKKLNKQPIAQKNPENIENEAETPTEKPKKAKKEPAPLLPMRNVVILSAISIICIFIISLQTGFQVKPIYDIGEKVTGYEIVNKLGWLGTNVAKCVWILLTLGCMDRIAKEAVTSLQVTETKKKWLIPVITGVGVLIFGIFDVIFYNNAFAWTYLLFYVAFTAVYYLTEKNGLKALLLIILIYLF